MNPESIPVTDLELSVRTANLLHRNVPGCTLADLRTLVLCEDPSHPAMKALGARGRKEVREVVENTAALIEAAPEETEQPDPEQFLDAYNEAVRGLTQEEVDAIWAYVRAVVAADG